VLFSIYVGSFGSYDRLYGSLGAVVVLLMWFYVSAFALLIGATVDAQLGRGGGAARQERGPSVAATEPPRDGA
jgi:membrane protein